MNFYLAIISDASSLQMPSGVKGLWSLDSCSVDSGRDGSGSEVSGGDNGSDVSGDSDSDVSGGSGPFSGPSYEDANRPEEEE